MIVLPYPQGSDEWRQARVGLPTASGFSNLLTKTGRTSTTSQAYLQKLVAESYLGRALDDNETGFMTRGKVMEDEAIAWYEMARDVAVQRVGLCLRDDKRVGCSPDGLIHPDGGIEVKVPTAAIHVGYLLDPQSLVEAYKGQVQGALYVTGRVWWDLVSYNPEIPPVVVRVQRDAEYLLALEPALNDFLKRLEAAKQKIGKRP